jgi:hypothetical protein
LLPFIPYEYKAKNKPEKVVLKVLQESLMKSNKVVTFIMGVLPYVDQCINFANQLATEEILNRGQMLSLGWYLRDAGH